MSRRTVYPTSVWITWVLIIPLALLCLGIVLLVTTELGNLPFDSGGLWWLGGVVPLAGLLFLYGVIRRQRAISRFTSDELAPLLAARVSPGRQAFRAGLVVLALLMLTVAILGPRWGIYMEKQKVYGVDVVVAVDVSRSMLAEDVEPSRLERAKTEIRQQLTERRVFQRAHRLALLAFAGSTSLKVPLTTDYLAFRSKLADLSIHSAPRGGTAIAAAIQAATDLFAGSPEEATKIILLFTDGEDHEGQAVEAAKAAYEDHGIRVFTVGVGDAGRTVGAQVPASDRPNGTPLLYDGQIVFSKLDVAGLRQIADVGNGQYAPVQDLYALVDAVSKMRRAELSAEERKRHKPRYQWFVAMALLLLGLETFVAEYAKGGDGLPKRTWQVEGQS
ncbi:MAG: VWA domain-containing protein [Planctomycetes bacterium]|nr:VWA domain-containing protein [Planctomycetota bacterium]